MQWSRALPMVTALEAGEGEESDAGGGGERVNVGVERVRRLCWLIEVFDYH